ncbi:MAG: acetyl-CoA carboxylase biotin carboxyl carrier protein [Candidatus Latescibacteria bacterium]|nr:acetyl-CoA carboxylase biotin carboxyl carrier protein [Candidatus Latescibacterota bacterium]
MELLQAHGLDEIEVEVSMFGRMRVRVARAREARNPGADAAPRPPSPPVAAPADAETEAFHTIRSPMVGKFYRGPAPDTPSYASEGDLVSSGQVICIIEAMKIMNEIESDVKGRVVRILVENAQPVEYHQPLFLIEPV